MKSHLIWCGIISLYLWCVYSTLGSWTDTNPRKNERPTGADDEDYWLRCGAFDRANGRHVQRGGHGRPVQFRGRRRPELDDAPSQPHGGHQTGAPRASGGDGVIRRRRRRQQQRGRAQEARPQKEDAGYDGRVRVRPRSAVNVSTDDVILMESTQFHSHVLTMDGMGAAGVPLGSLEGPLLAGLHEAPPDGVGAPTGGGGGVVGTAPSTASTVAIKRKYTKSEHYKQRRRHDRFNGMSEEEVRLRTLPDHLTSNLDVVIVSCPATAAPVYSLLINESAVTFSTVVDAPRRPPRRPLPT